MQGIVCTFIPPILLARATAARQLSSQQGVNGRVYVAGGLTSQMTQYTTLHRRPTHGICVAKQNRHALLCPALEVRTAELQQPATIQ